MEVTRHGGKRLRERLGIPKKAVTRMAERALAEGKRHGEFVGSFRRYLDAVYLDHGNANNMRVYMGFLFLFHEDILITAWVLPGKYRRNGRLVNRS